MTILSIAWRYGEDIKTKNAAAHSTFHYELMRVLCRAAGFTAEEAELIAVADQATDTGEFKGEFSNSTAVVIDSTQRTGKNVLYWHFARRDSSSATGGWSYPGGRNTCAYFISAAGACADHPELNEIEKWAVAGINALSVDVPAASVNGGLEQPVAGKSSLALAIYLHALADSYSHEACMKAAQFRGHNPRPQECTAVYWHEQAEFGSVPSRDAGVPYTVEAAWATWLAVKWFRQQNGLIGPPLWSDEQARQFIGQWAALDQARDRREMAMTAWQALQ
ncbi:MAG: hypothetical protein ONB48_19425 [candidate division KSB1 bacterium]|nr:hypothetical protein [candidate division KSB1 bacterium]MDZ7274138.1 hypothetical protein [candidate division KSB1 bacterium]MDZ7287817.1 hypothetical protein [candidate division KSB1 bacterium]MDZ7296737.1 hypothetical protein [candidate division KSB1 bacterium]MDZ7347603.1 hypothetical protein [candidate division KSB1 bacterium]